jgi:hypothetical protein
MDTCFYFWFVYFYLTSENIKPVMFSVFKRVCMGVKIINNKTVRKGGRKMDIIIMGVGGSLIFLAITWLCIRHNKKEIERNPDYKIQGVDE